MVREQKKKKRDMGSRGNHRNERDEGNEEKGGAEGKAFSRAKGRY